MTERGIYLSRVVDAPRADVWAAFTTAEGARTFFAPGAHIEPRVGGAYELYFMPEAPPGDRGSDGCTILEIEPPSRLAYTWNFPPSLPAIRHEKTRVTLDFTAEDGGRTHVAMRHTEWREGPDWDRGFEYFQVAWQVVLDRLVRRFAEGPIDWSEAN